MSHTDRKVLVWDVATRLFHWLVVVLVAAAYATWRLNWMDVHAEIGEVLLTLVLFRVLWGFFGSDSARFRHFLASPAVAARHLMSIFHREPDHQAGHNPAGGWMVLLILFLLLAEILTGIYVLNDVADEGPFTELVPPVIVNALTALHSIFWNVLLAAIAAHLWAILLYAIAKRQNLVVPMITGWKMLPQTVPRPRIAGVARALILLGCSALAAAGLTNFL
jgi:cytochrome b